MNKKTFAMRFVAGLSILSLVLSLLPVGAIKFALAATPVVTITTPVNAVETTSTPTYEITADQQVRLFYYGCDSFTLTVGPGTQEVQMDPLTDGVYDCKIQAVNSAGEYTGIISLGTFIVDTGSGISASAGDLTPPTITITPATTNSLTPITDTVITVTDNNSMSAVDVSVVNPSSPNLQRIAQTSSLNCTPANGTTITCSISIDATGNLVVNAKDAAGNSTSNGYGRYTVGDTTAPVFAFGSTLTSTSPIVESFSVTDDVSIAAADVVIVNTSTANYSGFTCSNSNSTTVNCSVTVLNSGTINFSADDSANNFTNSSRTYAIAGVGADVTAPVVTIVPPASKVGPSPITGTSVTVTDDNSMSASQIYVDGLSTATTNNFSCAPANGTSITCFIDVLTDGSLTISAVDTNGNFGSDTETGYLISTVGDLINPTIFEVTPIGSTTDTTPNYTFNSSEAGTISYSGSCSSNTTTAVAGNNTVTFNTLAVGNYSNCSLTVTDASSNVSTPLNISGFSIISGGGPTDTTAPTLTLSAAVTPNPTTDTTPDFSFISDEAGTILYAGGCASSTVSAVVGVNTITFDTPALNLGTYLTCTVSVRDGNNNTSTALTVPSFTVISTGSSDVTAPSIAINAVTTNSTGTITDTTISVGDAGGLANTNVFIDAATTVTASSLNCTPVAVSANSLTCTISISAANATQSLVIRAMDNAGNVNTASRTGYVISPSGDFTAPTLTLITAVPTPTQDQTPSYTFISSEAGSVTHTGPCTSPATAAVAGLNTFSFNTLANGTYTTCVLSVTDASGNSSTLNIPSFTVDTVTGLPIDTTAPTIAMNVPTSTSTTGSITNTTIRVDDETAIDVSDVLVGPSTTVTYNTFNCTQTSPTRVDCTIVITGSGTLEVVAYDSSSNRHSASQFGYSVTTTTPPAPTTGGGGGGGGGACYAIPSGGITINSGATVTNKRVVNIKVAYENTYQMIISEDVRFMNLSYVPITGETQFTLSEGAGEKTVYAFFRSYCGNTATYSDTINFDPTAPDQPTDVTVPTGREEDVEGDVLGDVFFADGTLIRGTNAKVYVIVGGYKKHIPTLSELQKYAGVPILNISDELLAKIPDFKELTGEVLGSQEYADGTLLRSPSMKIYHVETQKLRHIKTLEELRSDHFGKPIINVPQSTIDRYQIVLTKQFYNEGDLIRGTDMKIYVIKDGKKVYIPTIDQLAANYFGQPIYKVTDDILKLY